MMLPARFPVRGGAGLSIRSLPGLVLALDGQQSLPAASSGTDGAKLARLVNLAPGQPDPGQPSGSLQPAIDRQLCPGRVAIRFAGHACLTLPAPAAPVRTVLLAVRVPASAVAAQGFVSQAAATDLPAVEVGLA